jgi:hypothetical protein
MKDVQRCMPEVNFFRTPQTQQTMLDILFVRERHGKELMFWDEFADNA